MNVSYSEENTIPEYNMNSIHGIFQNPHYFSILLLIGIIVIFVVFFSFIGKSGNSGDSSSGSSFRILEILVFVIFIIVVIVNIHFFMKFPNFDFSAQMHNLFSGKKPSMNVNVGKPPAKSSSSSSSGEVFHIPNNIYTYEEGKALCKAYDSKLATYDQIENAYKKGANWCSYGWSSDQMAFFPTQKSVYNNLQKQKGHEHDCGRPGINGGFIANPNVKFGVNCYGKKPKFNKNDKAYMNSLKTKSTNPAENAMSNAYKNKLDKIVVAPFNTNKWSLKSGNKAVHQADKHNNQTTAGPPPASSSSSTSAQPEPFI